MKPREISALDLLEESSHLLRALPASAIAYDFIGTLPFVLALLFFWYDMSHGAFAGEHVGLASLGLALLFVWMNVWQSLFALRVRQALDGNPRPQRTARLIAQQSIVQPTCLLAVPAAALVTLPFATAYAFYQNFNCLEPSDNVRETCRQSLRAAVFAPAQGWILLGLLALIGCTLFVNLGAGIFLAAKLVNSFFGLQSTFTRNPSAVFNTSFAAIVAGLTYVLLDPLVKTTYALRCFYAASRTSGADLRAALQRLNPSHVLLLLLLIPPAALKAQPAIPTPQLDSAIDRVIHQAKYSWRLPRQNTAIQSDSMLERLARAIADGFAKLTEWVRELLRRKPQIDTSGGGAPGGTAIRFTTIAVCLLLAAAATVMAWRLWGQAADQAALVESHAVASPVDIEDETLAAEQLPEEDWLRLGRDLLAQGDYRKGVRAFHLAALANLGGREFIRLGKAKTSREYERELARRARGAPHVIPAFAENVRIYERTWYGDHLADARTLELLNASLERIRADA